LAQSKKLTPASRQRLNSAAEVASSASPPNDIVPKHRLETWTPVRPKVRYSMRNTPYWMDWNAGNADNAEHADRGKSPQTPAY